MGKNPKNALPSGREALARGDGNLHIFSMGKQKKSQISAASASEGQNLRFCDQPDCLAEGPYPAPRSREDLRQYYWFCLDHVRAYNRAWNFYAGMSEAEVEALDRDDTVWQRPTWPLGGHGAPLQSPYKYKIRDTFDFFEGEKASKPAGKVEPETEEAKAFRVLEMTPPTTPKKIKARYKALVKRHHPDAHGGSKTCEDRLKEINLAYQTLMNAHCL